MIVAYLFVIFNVVLAYTMYAMWHFADLSYLGVLITDIAAQVLTGFLYMWKSKAENTKNGIIYDKAMAELNLQYQNNINLDDSNNAVG